MFERKFSDLSKFVFNHFSLFFRTMLLMILRLLAKLLTFPGHLKRFKEGTVSAK